MMEPQSGVTAVTIQQRFARRARTCARAAAAAPPVPDSCYGRFALGGRNVGEGVWQGSKPTDSSFKRRRTAARSLLLFEKVEQPARPRTGELIASARCISSSCAVLWQGGRCQYFSMRTVSGGNIWRGYPCLSELVMG